VALLRRTLPELERPAGALRVWARGSQRVVVRHSGVWVEPDGQTVFDFEGGRPEQSDVAALPQRAAGAAGARVAAREWFERGCRLDSARESFGAAIEAYQRALELDPALADAHCNLGAVYYQQKRLSAARRCYERAVALEPRHVEANLNLAMLFEDLERCESALPHYKAALAAAPLLADVHVSLALLYEKLGLPRRGRSHWRRYLQLEPRGAWAEVARSRLDP
jgi:tetratricopeptide (TPR) repeat protein